MTASYGIGMFGYNMVCLLIVDSLEWINNLK